MNKLTVSLTDAYNALLDADGDIPKAAQALDIRPHKLRTMVDRHAELQSIVRDRAERIIALAEATVLDHLGELGPAIDRIPTAKWALEHLQSDRYKKAHVNEVKPQKLKDLSFDELEKLRREALEQIKMLEPPIQLVAEDDQKGQSVSQEENNADVQKK